MVAEEVYVDVSFDGACVEQCGRADCPCSSLQEGLRAAYTVEASFVRILLAAGNYSGLENSQLVLNSSNISISIE